MFVLVLTTIILRAAKYLFGRGVSESYPHVPQEEHAAGDVRNHGASQRRCGGSLCQLVGSTLGLDEVVFSLFETSAAKRYTEPFHNVPPFFLGDFHPGRGDSGFK